MTEACSARQRTPAHWDRQGVHSPLRGEWRLPQKISEADHREVMVMERQLLLSPHCPSVERDVSAHLTGASRPAIGGL